MKINKIILILALILILIISVSIYILKPIDQQEIAENDIVEEIVNIDNNKVFFYENDKVSVSKISAQIYEESISNNQYQSVVLHMDNKKALDDDPYIKREENCLLVTNPTKDFNNSFCDIPLNEDDSNTKEVKRYKLLAYYPDINKRLIRVNLWEGGQYILNDIDRPDIEGKKIWGVPRFSPDGDMFFVIGNSISYGDETGIQIWKKYNSGQGVDVTLTQVLVPDFFEEPNYISDGFWVSNERILLKNSLGLLGTSYYEVSIK